MIVLDTNVVSELFREAPDPGVVSWLEGLSDDVAITSVTIAELLAGVRRMPEGRRRDVLEVAVRAAIEPYRGSGAILAFDESAAGEYAEVLVMRERAGRPIHTADAQIAAICRAHGAVCATRNVRDFDGTGAEVLDPWHL